MIPHQPFSFFLLQLGSPACSLSRASPSFPADRTQIPVIALFPEYPLSFCSLGRLMAPNAVWKLLVPPEIFILSTCTGHTIKLKKFCLCVCVSGVCPTAMVIQGVTPQHFPCILWWMATYIKRLPPAPHPSAQAMVFPAALAAPLACNSMAALFFKLSSIITTQTFQMQGCKSSMVQNAWTWMYLNVNACTYMYRQVYMHFVCVT